jgi:phytoene desaturase
MLKVLPDLVRLRADRGGRVRVAVHPDERLRQVFSFHPLLVGGNPFRPRRSTRSFTSSSSEWGVWFAMGGTGALVQALVRSSSPISAAPCAYDSEVAEITVVRHERATTGVRLASGERCAADAVGPTATSRRPTALVPGVGAPPHDRQRMEKHDYSMSLFVIYFGTDQAVREHRAP